MSEIDDFLKKTGNYNNYRKNRLKRMLYYLCIGLTKQKVAKKCGCTTHTTYKDLHYLQGLTKEQFLMVVTHLFIEMWENPDFLPDEEISFEDEE